MDGVGARELACAFPGVELLPALAGDSCGAEPLHGAENPPDPAEQVEAGDYWHAEEEEECPPDHASLRKVFLLGDTELPSHHPGSRGRQQSPVDVREVGEDQEEGDQPAQGEEQGRGGAGVAREQQLAVPDQVSSEECQHAQV